MLTPLHGLNQIATTELQTYRSAAEFHQLWRQLDQASGYLKVSIVAAFEDQFALPIVDAIRRQYRGLQLTIVTKTTRLPGLISRVDLALHCISLGWQSIQFSTNWEEALERQVNIATFEHQHVALIPSLWRTAPQ